MHSVAATIAYVNKLQPLNVKIWLYINAINFSCFALYMVPHTHPM